MAESFHPKFFRDAQGVLHLNAGEYGGRIDVAAFSGDGTRLLTVLDVSVAQVWDTATGELIGTLCPQSPLSGSDSGPTTDPFRCLSKLPA